MKQGLESYKKTAVSTASKEQILLMLYQEAIKNCQKAIQFTREKNLPKKGFYIGKLQDIIIELNNSLDLENGGSFAKELTSLYDYIIFASTQAHIKVEVPPLEGCLDVLKTLYEGWEKAIKSLKS